MHNHYVPQHHLRRFATPNNAKLIWRYDIDCRRFQCLPIKKVAQERNFYSERRERQLNEQVEGPAQRLLKRLLNAERISQGQRKLLALYFLVMWVRVPRMRARMESWIPEMREKALTATGRTATETDERQAEEMLRSAIRDVPVSQNLAAEIEAMKWTLVKARLPDYFVTSDCPLYRGEWRDNGARITELVLPLSLATALICQKQGRREGFSIVYAGRELVQKIRRYVISVGTRYVFSHERAEWIEAVAQDERALRIEEDELFAHLRPSSAEESE